SDLPGRWARDLADDDQPAAEPVPIVLVALDKTTEALRKQFQIVVEPEKEIRTGARGILPGKAHPAVPEQVAAAPNHVNTGEAALDRLRGAVGRRIVDKKDREIDVSGCGAGV